MTWLDNKRITWTEVKDCRREIIRRRVKHDPSICLKGDNSTLRVTFVNGISGERAYISNSRWWPLRRFSAAHKSEIDFSYL